MALVSVSKAAQETDVRNSAATEIVCRLSSYNKLEEAHDLLVLDGIGQHLIWVIQDGLSDGLICCGGLSIGSD
jgi:hypothetical protein